MLYASMHAVVPPLLKAIWRPVIHGLDNIPRTGPVILASNHLSFADSVVIPAIAPRKVVFLAKADYFTGTGVTGALQRAWFEGLGKRVLGEPRIGAHGTLIFFVHPKDMGGQLTEIMETPKEAH